MTAIQPVGDAENRCELRDAFAVFSPEGPVETVRGTGMGLAMVARDTRDHRFLPIRESRQLRVQDEVASVFMVPQLVDGMPNVVEEGRGVENSALVRPKFVEGRRRVEETKCQPAYLEDMRRIGVDVPCHAPRGENAPVAPAFGIGFFHSLTKQVPGCAGASIRRVNAVCRNRRDFRTQNYFDRSSVCSPRSINCPPPV